jgi:hypothetical protein
VAERAVPRRLERARARARARGRHALAELGGAEAERKQARRFLVYGVDRAEPGREPEPAAPARCAACVLMQRRLIGLAQALVEVEVELTKLEDWRRNGEDRTQRTTGSEELGERRKEAFSVERTPVRASAERTVNTHESDL